MKQALEPIFEDADGLGPAQEAAAPTTSSSTSEWLDYLSNLKTLLTALVILHHTAVAYGGAGQHVYRSLDGGGPASQPALVAFNAVNQTFFMALFFFIAGYLSRHGLVRHTQRDGIGGVGGFVKDRACRLGGPTLVYSLFGRVCCEVIIAVWRNKVVNFEHVRRHLSSVRGVRGPVWFCALLLVFDVLAAIIWAVRTFFLGGRQNAYHRVLSGTDGSTGSKPGGSVISGWRITVALLGLTLLDIVWRIPFPVGAIFEPLNLNLGYLLQYIAAYTFGFCVTDPGDAILHRRTIVCLVAASVASGSLLARSLAGVDDFSPVFGGLDTCAAAYAVWNNFTGYLISSALLYLFRLYADCPWPSITSLAYSAFLLHIPVSTLVQLSFESWQTDPVRKTAFVGAINVVCSWAAAWACDAVWTLLHSVSITSSSDATEKHSAKSRGRTLSKGARAIEILEGLDEVGR